MGIISIDIYCAVGLPRQTKKKRINNPYLEKTQQEKEVEIAIEKEKSRRNGPPGGIGGGGF